MYRCKCGYESKTTNYCGECNKLLKCDCTDIKEGRIKDVNIPYCDYEKDIFIKMYYKICNTCGDVKEVKQGRK